MNKVKPNYANHWTKLTLSLLEHNEVMITSNHCYQFFLVLWTYFFSAIYLAQECCWLIGKKKWNYWYYLLEIITHWLPWYLFSVCTVILQSLQCQLPLKEELSKSAFFNNSTSALLGNITPRNTENVMTSRMFARPSLRFNKITFNGAL